MSVACLADAHAELKIGYRSYLTKCLEAYYPESLNVVMIHEAPWVVCDQNVVFVKMAADDSR